MGPHVRRARPVALALVLSLALAAPASSDFIAPTVVAQHAFVGDPLQGLDTVDGTLFGIAPDERTAMASTTKIMTLHLLDNAIAVGFVSPNDLVTVSPLAASIGGSTMADMNGVSLQAGEVVSLDALAHGMMYPSGNNAAWAIAEYVATAIYGPFPSSQNAVDAFIDLMNDHAASMGLVETHFTSPNGFDDPYEPGVTPTPDELNHYTTARELSKLMAHAITDEYFQSVVGLQGTYTATGTPPSGPVKTYSWTWGSNYPGWEGAKGGGTQNCNGPNQACVVTSASRLGRRVVIAEMQGDPANEQAPLLDVGFATIFHPDLMAETTAGAVLAQSVECLPDRRALTAVITGASALQLTTWSLPQGVGSIEKIASSPVRKVAASSGPTDGSKGSVKNPNDVDVDVLRLADGHIITASRTDGVIRLGGWDIAVDGTPNALVAGVQAGNGRSVSLAPVSAHVFVTAVRASNNQLVVKSWRLAETRTGDWTISLLDTELGGGFLADVRDVAAGSSGVPSVFSGTTPVLVPIRQASGDSAFGFYDVDPTNGSITQNVYINVGITGSHFSVATMMTDAPDDELFARQFFAVSVKDDAENVHLIHFRVDPDGDADFVGKVQGSLNVLETSATAFDHGGVVVTARDVADRDVVGVYEGRRTSTDGIAGDEVVKHVHGHGRAVDSCRAPTASAEADVLTTVIDSGDLTLRLFRIGARPLRG